MKRAAALEVEFFRMLNRVVEPQVRAGFASPRIVPSGLVVIETTGRKSGRVSRTPLAATRIADHIVVGTFRGERSQWVQNLAAHPETRFWLSGRPREAKAFVLRAGARTRPPRGLPAPVRWAVEFLRPYTLAGWAFAVLAPTEAGSRRTLSAASSRA